MKASVRQEQEADYKAVFQLIEKAFANEAISDHQEQYLVNRLRKSEAFIPELSLVAITDEQLVGHILLTKIKINNVAENFDSLALAPVSVLPLFQGKGIGGALIKAAHAKAKALGHKSIILLGHENYYPRFGYKQAHQFGISLPFDVPKENCMAIELMPDALQKVSGIVEYPPEFSE